MKQSTSGIIALVCAVLCLAAIGAGTPLHAAPIFPETGFRLVYDLPIPEAANYDKTGTVPYSVNNAASIANGSFKRVGYELQLQLPRGALQTVAVSMDAFTIKASLLGVPTEASGGLFNDVRVADMDVTSNVAGVVTGRGFSTGYVQFWSNFYGYKAGKFATGEDVINVAAPASYGSMQIGNGTGDTVFAYNGWDYGIFGSDLGIGNRAINFSDWTFAFNAQTYGVKDMSVWVSSPVPEPGSLAILLTGLGAFGLLRRRRRSAL